MGQIETKVIVAARAIKQFSRESWINMLWPETTPSCPNFCGGPDKNCINFRAAEHLDGPPAVRRFKPIFCAAMNLHVEELCRKSTVMMAWLVFGTRQLEQEKYIYLKYIILYFFLLKKKEKKDTYIHICHKFQVKSRKLSEGAWASYQWEDLFLPPKK